MKKQLLDENLLWPNSLSHKIHAGFSDDELEMICDWGLRGYDATLPYRSPVQIYWPVELYSLGRCYRDWLNLPNWCPLPLYGDHGVAYIGNLAPHERQSKPLVHLTWSKDRFNSLAEKEEKRILRIPHPWITFRRKVGLKRQEEAQGTLIFYSHSNTGIEIVDYDWESYFSSLMNLPQEYHPLVICMHRHDVEKGYHKKVRDYNIPIISAGETSSPYFVERFYSMISSFNFATSNSGGSELFYCHEFGIPYFIQGNKPTYVNFSHNQIPTGVLRPADSVAERTQEKKRQLFSEFPPHMSSEKDQFVTDILGLDLDEDLCRKTLRNHLYIELWRHLPEVVYGVTRYLASTYLPKRSKRYLKTLSSKFKGAHP